MIQKAYDAINDSTYLKHNTEWTSSNSLLVKCENEEDDLLDEVIEQLSAFGVPEEEYTIEEMESEMI